MRRILLVTPLLAAIACGGDGPQGFAWDVRVASAFDDGRQADYFCPDYEWQGWGQTFRYVLDFESGTAYTTVAVDADVFAAGQLSGCTLAYDSVVWGQLWEDPEFGEDFEIRWQLSGEADIRQGASGGDCGLADGVDWSGKERFDIIYSEHPRITSECWFELLVEGKYVGQIE
jgi:hypothetical protein